MCCAIKFCFQIRLIESLRYHSTSDSLRYLPSWIKVPFLSTPKLSSQAIALPISLVLGMQQMEGAFSILGLNVSLKTVILRHLSCFYHLSFHTGWRKTVLSCICLSDSLFSRAVQKTPPVCWRTSWGVEKWLVQKVSFTCHIKLHNLWERWITGTVKQVCHEMKWKKVCFHHELLFLLFPGPESLILLVLLVRKSDIPGSFLTFLLYRSYLFDSTQFSLHSEIFSQCLWPNQYWTSETLQIMSFNLRV